jgi:hypothetical protein
LGFTAAIRYAEWMSDELIAKHPWYRLTPDRLIVGLIVVECLLWLSEVLGWPRWQKGYAVVIGLTLVGLAMHVLFLWWLLALAFRLQFQFGIRSLLVLVVAVALPFSWLGVKMRQAERQQEKVKAIQSTGGAVRYAHEFDASGKLIGANGTVWDDPIDEWGNAFVGRAAPGAEAPSPAWLRHLLGDDFFGTAVWASVGTDDGLAQVKTLKSLTRLTLDSCFTIHPRDHTGPWLIGGEQSLHNSRPSYPHDQITDSGLQSIEKMAQLQDIEIWWAPQISETAVNRLRQALPNCKVHE